MYSVTEDRACFVEPRQSKHIRNDGFRRELWCIVGNLHSIEESICFETEKKRKEKKRIAISTTVIEMAFVL